MTKERKALAHAMAFYHRDGLPAAWKQAIRFAGKGGRLATMPDIVAARLATKPGADPWETYYTTLTAEYFGFSRQGNLILIIAHGIGPMSTFDGIQKAYSWEYKDKDRNRNGGRITHQEFLDLEAGKFGNVEIIDFEAYCRRYEYPFLQVLRSSQAMSDPVLKARLGPLAEKYMLAHTAFARQWHFDQSGVDPENRYNLPNHEAHVQRLHNMHFAMSEPDSDPFIIEIRDAANLCYTFGSEHGHRQIEKGYAFAHLISTGSLMNLHHTEDVHGDRKGYVSLVLSVSCHEWGNGVRLVAIQDKGARLSRIQTGPDAHELLSKHWQELFVPVKEPGTIGLCGLMKIGKQWFTQYPKKGESMDTWEPEYAVTSMTKLGQPVFFRTKICGYHMFVRFGLNELKDMAPPQANAYSFVGEWKIEMKDGNPEFHTNMVQFYRIEADTTKRLIRTDKLCHDYDTMMKLLAKEKAA